MRDTLHLVANKGGVVRMTKRRPTLDQGEIAFRLHVSIDKAVFEALPTARIEIDQEHAILPDPDVEVLQEPPYEERSLFPAETVEDAMGYQVQR